MIFVERILLWNIPVRDLALPNIGKQQPCTKRPLLASEWLGVRLTLARREALMGPGL
jgi:hypothetical protein